MHIFVQGVFLKFLFSIFLTGSLEEIDKFVIQGGTVNDHWLPTHRRRPMAAVQSWRGREGKIQNENIIIFGTPPTFC